MGGRGGGSSIASRAAAPSVNSVAPRNDADRQALIDVFNRINDAKTERLGFEAIVTVTEVRSALGELGWSREKQEQEMVKMVRERKAILSPQSNQKILTARQREDFIWMGGEPKSLFHIERGNR